MSTCRYRVGIYNLVTGCCLAMRRSRALCPSLLILACPSSHTGRVRVCANYLAHSTRCPACFSLIRSLCVRPASLALAFHLARSLLLPLPCRASLASPSRSRLTSPLTALPGRLLVLYLTGHPSLLSSSIGLTLETIVFTDVHVHCRT